MALVRPMLITPVLFTLRSFGNIFSTYSVVAFAIDKSLLKKFGLLCERIVCSLNGNTVGNVQNLLEIS